MIYRPLRRRFDGGCSHADVIRSCMHWAAARCCRTLLRRSPSPSVPRVTRAVGSNITKGSWSPFGDHPSNWNDAENISMTPAQG